MAVNNYASGLLIPYKPNVARQRRKPMRSIARLDIAYLVERLIDSE